MVISGLFRLSVSLLVLRFILLVLDPRVYYEAIAPQAPSINNSAFLTTSLGAIANGIYAITNLFTLPVNVVFDALASLYPPMETSMFPAWPAMNSLYALQTWLMDNGTSIWASLFKPLLQLDPILTLPGVFDWLSLVAIPVAWVIFQILQWVVVELRHYLLVLWTELTFSDARQEEYERALTQQNKDLVNLNRDVSELSQTTSQLHGQTVTDEMTGAFNKRFFVSKLKDLFAEAQRDKTTYGMMMMDIDHFKKLNDTYGHATGDDVLIVMAKVAMSHTPKQKAYFCRYGGEEFGIIFYDLSLKEMIATGDAVRAGIEAERFTEHPDIRVTISQGLYVADFKQSDGEMPDYTDPEETIKLADAKLYEAKESGRNRLCVEVWPS
jgi:diguanylate cyclase (GGDEF)-like protein